MSPVSQAPPRTGHPFGRGSTGVRLPVPGTDRAPDEAVRGELAPRTVRGDPASNQTVRAYLAPQTVGADPAPKTDRAHQASKTTAADAAEETS